MYRPLPKFVLALLLYGGWVLSLGAMAWLAADRPQLRQSAPAAR